jgi:hypothetical protein
MTGLTEKEKSMLALWNKLTPEKKKEAVALYEKMKGDEPELMGFLPLLAALVPIAKKAWSIGKGLVNDMTQQKAAEKFNTSVVMDANGNPLPTVTGPLKAGAGFAAKLKTAKQVGMLTSTPVLIGAGVIVLIILLTRK